MTGWLLDTDAISAFAPGKRPLPPETAAWFGERTDTLFLSSISAAEIEAGIAKLRRTASLRRASELRRWFDRIVEVYSDRVLPFDLDAAREAGLLADAARADGRHPGFADIAIAAIAKSRGFAVVTLNLRHFAVLDIDVVNPFGSDASG